jgi:hypothetical protein
MPEPVSVPDHPISKLEGPSMAVWVMIWLAGESESTVLVTSRVSIGAGGMPISKSMVAIFVMIVPVANFCLGLTL